MPIDIEFRHDGGVYRRGKGIVTGEDLLSANDAAYTPERIRTIVYQVTDLSAMDGFDVSPEDIREIAKQDLAASAVNPHMIFAAVGTEDIVFGMGRMWQILSEIDSGPTFDSAVFRTLTEAEQWIHDTLQNRS